MYLDRIKSLTRSAGFRITLWHSIAFMVGAIVVFITAYFLLARSIDEQTNDTIEFRLYQFATEYTRGGSKAVIELCSLRKGRAQKAFFVRMANPENVTTFLRDPDDWSDFPHDKLSQVQVNKKDETQWVEISGSDETVLRISSIRLPDDNILQVGKTLELRKELLEEFRSGLAIIAVVVIVGGIVGGATASFRTLRPVKHLTVSVQSILDTGKFTSRVPSDKTGDEIDRLVQLFNQMLGKIDLLIHGMRDSLDNVAHDLRTPMTRLRNVASKALEQNGDKETCLNALGDCLEESERVMTMLFTLMDIAEAESGVMKLDVQRVSVTSLVNQTVDLYEHVAEEKGITLTNTVPWELTVEADSGRLQRALGNLLDNALKYTPEGGAVNITGIRQNDAVSITISDNGEGIPHDEIPRIWERLYRVDKSRSQRGLGLGLSFVKAIVEAHEGSVSVESKIGEGARFTIKLPL